MGPRLRRDFEGVLDGTDRSARAGVLRTGLRAASWAYGAGVGVRNGLYDAGVLRPARVDARVISIGNLTAGGTGKTPIAVALAAERADRGERVAIVTRGYRPAQPAQTDVVVVSDGEGTRWEQERAGDEALLIADLAPHAAVLMSANRVAAATLAVKQFGAQTVILDDGFQHRRLARDEDWVLVDARAPWGYGALLPRGLLREPRRALARATTLVITRADQADDVAALEADLRRYNADAPLVWATHEARRLWAWPSRDGMPIERLRGERVLAMSGIGNPQSFEDTLRSLGADVKLVRRFPDHYPYNVCDLEDTLVLLQSEGLAAVVTTEKDAVRFARIAAPELPLWVLGIDAQLHTERPQTAG